MGRRVQGTRAGMDWWRVVEPESTNFLVAKKSKSIRPTETLAKWLHRMVVEVLLPEVAKLRPGRMWRLGLKRPAPKAKWPTLHPSINVQEHSALRSRVAAGTFQEAQNDVSVCGVLV